MKFTFCFVCGAKIPEVEGPVCEQPYIPQSPGCWKYYTEILAREYGEWKYPDIHRLTVDCYAAQHPAKEPNQKSSQSVAVHLAGIYLALNQKLPAKEITDKIGELVVKNKGDFKLLTPPPTLGGVTVVDVHHAATLSEHEQLVHQWARSVWDAWNAEWDYIANLVSK